MPLSIVLAKRFTLGTLCTLCILITTPSVWSQDGPITKSRVGVTWTFASVEQGRKVLTTDDEFIRRLSPFDRSARLKTESEVTKQQHLDFVVKCVLEWTPAEKERFTEVLREVKDRLASLPLPVGDEILLIKTNGNEEGQAPYTRSNAIIFPLKRINSPPKKLKDIIFHELFHIASRKNQTMRDRLYSVIGFEKCGELNFPTSLADRKLTNPDAPVIQHCIEVTVDGEKEWAMPVLYSRTEKYDEQRGGEFFDYLKFELLIVKRDAATGKLADQSSESAPRLVSPRQATGFLQQIGVNTGYIIHPEEILADNFSLLARNIPDLKSPEIVESMKQIILETAAQQPPPR